MISARASFFGGFLLLEMAFLIRVASSCSRIFQFPGALSCFSPIPGMTLPGGSFKVG